MIKDHPQEGIKKDILQLISKGYAVGEILQKCNITRHIYKKYYADKSNPSKAKNGLVIDEMQFDELCRIQCTSEEIQAVLGIKADTLNKWAKSKGYKTLSDAIQKKSQAGKMSLRRVQFTKAVEGNTALLIWLGKNHLNQTDKPPEALDEVEIKPIGFAVKDCRAGGEKK